MGYGFQTCGCLRQVLPVGKAWWYLWEEVVELVEARSVDNFVEEVSDVAFATGRLLGAVKGVEYVHVPGDGACCEKMAERVQSGCVRSMRNRVDGCCPTEG